LDGHVSAFRLGSEFSYKSVVFIPESKYYLWFSHLLKPHKHFIQIKEDLSDLVDKVKWCRDNDEICKKIAENGYNFYKKYLSYDGIMDYMQSLLNKISDNMPTNIMNVDRRKLRLAIITIYRDSDDNSRLKQKRLFVYMMTKLFKPFCEFKIIIVEQNKGEKFNIGKLKNIGFEYINKYGPFDNYIFTDIDIIPDSALIKYYLKITDGFNLLAYKGTRYESSDSEKDKQFFGGCISCTKKIYEQINGYPNNYWGWGGEDDELGLRVREENIKVYKNTNGRIIDIEEKDGLKISIRDKLDLIKKQDNYNVIKWENISNYKNYKKNGLNTLHYELLYEKEFENVIHIIIDVTKQYDEKHYPHNYNLKEVKKKYN